MRAREQLVQIVNSRDHLSVEFHEDIALTQTGPASGTSRLDGDHEHASFHREVKVPDDAPVYFCRLPAHADVSAPDDAILDQPACDVLGRVDRDGEAETLRRQDHRRVHSDDFAAGIRERPAGITWIQRRGGLGGGRVVPCFLRIRHRNSVPISLKSFHNLTAGFAGQNTNKPIPRPVKFPECYRLNFFHPLRMLPQTRRKISAASVMNSSWKCRSCGQGASQLVLDLGLQPLANNLLRPEDLGKPEPKFPLRLLVCTECWLMQIADLIPPVELFTEYLYFSSFSDTMLCHVREASERYHEEFSLGPQSLVLEAASNDGYFLQNFQRLGVPCLGIEPATNIARVARQKGIETLEAFFDLDLARRLAAEGRRPDLILGNNVFAHAPDTNDFVAGLKTALKPEGRIVLEFPCGTDMIDKCEFDTIYHEHVFYFTLTPLLPLVRRQRLEIFRVERIPIHGGSIRVFLGHPGIHPVQNSVAELLAEETAKGVATSNYYSTFAQKVAEIRRTLTELLDGLKGSGKTLAAYGASAKGSTLLNYCGVGGETLDFVADRSNHKHGRLTPGTHVPIVPTEELAKRRPDYTLLLTWNFAEEILEQQRSYRDAGGRFIIPIPRVATL